ncbi:MAG: glycosyltransferase family 4 protein [bacterium]
MKIAFIGQKGIPAKLGGVEKHVSDLAVRLADQGHEVYVYARSNYTDKKQKEYFGVKIINLPSIPTKHLDAVSHTFLACADAILRRNFDVIHFHSIGPSSLLWMIKVFKPRTPVVATFHSQCYYHQKWGLFAKMYLKFGEYICCKLADKTITVSQTIKKYAEEKYHIKAISIPNGVNMPAPVQANIIKKNWNLDRDSYIFLATRLIRHKGVHYAIDSYKKLHTDKKLVIAGEGFFTDDYAQELKNLAGDNSNIIFVGKQFGACLAELFSNAYLFVQPSESEGLSIALLEAMSFGRAVLVSDIPENKEAAEDAGFYFKNKNVEDLSRQMDYLLKHKELVQEYGKNGLANVEKNFNWEDLTKRIIAVYDEVMILHQDKNKKRKFKSAILRSEI